MHALTVLAIGLFAAAAASDLARRRIPNPLVMALAALGLARLGLAVAAGAGPGVLGADLGVGLLVLALGAVFFRFGLLGGGDVKLLAAGALWIGTAQVAPFLMTTVLAGGLLALIFLAWATLARASTGRKSGPSLPYGVAIAAGGILTTLTAL